MKRSSLAILAIAVVIHVAMLAGWRWQHPLVPYFFDATVLSGGRGLDFYSIYQAGYNARHGADIYEGDPAKAPVVVPYFTPYRYLPVVAYTVGAGLSLLSPLDAYKVWLVIVELTLLACVGVTWRLTRHQPDLFARLAAMWLAFSPYYLELFMGQFSLVLAALVFGLLVLAVGRAAQPGERLPGGFDGLWLASVLWKVVTVVFVPVLVRLRRWRSLLLTGAVVLVTTLPYFLVFPAHWRDFARNNFGGSVAGHELGNLGFRQLVFEALAAVQAPAAGQALAQWAVLAACVGAALAVTFFYRGVRLTALLALWWVTFFLVSPQVWEHHYVMLLPMLVVLYWQRSHWAVLAIWLLLALPTPFGFIGLQPVIAANHALRAFPLEPAWQPLLQHASKAAPAAWLFAYCLRAAVQGAVPVRPNLRQWLQNARYSAQRGGIIR